ncbi:AraC family transcriptional regulator [Clostridium sp. AN503]|uniref:AraC family transcriptional regulator n=1 Tax=Clostridium sp. AN503 TaxID=3160598 RepID=UPI003457BEDE
MPSIQEQRHVYYDRDLQIEAYNLSGIVQKFPNHFHEYYVIGFVEGGSRHLWCRNQEYDLTAGDMILFNPRDNHCCAPVNGEILDYRAVNIDVDIMIQAAREITGQDYTPRFTQNVVRQSEIAGSIGELYDAILHREARLKKEEAFYFLLEQILQDFSTPFEHLAPPEPDAQVKMLCGYMEEHFAENISLDELLTMANFGKSYLLRAFTRQVGVSPYRYLQTIRLGRARKFLEQGMAPVDAAVNTGFSDQSHFTNFFKEYTGLTPKQYQKIFTEKGASL